MGYQGWCLGGVPLRTIPERVGGLYIRVGYKERLYGEGSPIQMMGGGGGQIAQRVFYPQLFEVLERVLVWPHLPTLDLPREWPLDSEQWQVDIPTLNFLRVQLMNYLCSP